MGIKSSMISLGLKCRAHAPGILMVGGIVASVGALACGIYAGHKTEHLIDEASEEIRRLNEELEYLNAQLNETEEGSEEESEVSAKQDEIQKKIRTVRVTTGFKLAALYAPATVLETISIMCGIKGHAIEKKRLAGTVAAYNGVLGAYTAQQKLLAEKCTDEELNGEVVKVVDAEGKPAELRKFPGKNIRDYCTFDWNADTVDVRCWNDSPYSRTMFLSGKEQEANEMLRRNHILLLNEVLDLIGLERTSAGCVLGWVYKGNDDHADHFVSFRSTPGYFADDEIDIDLTDPYTYDMYRNYRLCFNCDGIVYDKIDEDNGGFDTYSDCNFQPKEVMA